MQFIVSVEVRLDGRTLEIFQVAKLERDAQGIDAEELGLTLQDGKVVMQQVQDCVVRTQVSALSAAASICTRCHRDKRVKDLRSRRLRTVFGAVDVVCRRYMRCPCLGGGARIEWPLLRLALKRSTPELSYLLAKWGSTVPYRRAAELLSEFLPLGDGGVAHATVRRHTLAVGERLEQRVIEPAEYDWPESRRQPVPSARRITVAIDGTYIRANRPAWGRQHYVVAGRIDRDGRMAGRFAWIAQHPSHPAHFMKAALADQGCTSESRVAVLADGADGLPGVVDAATEQEPRRILDWFHISMRLRPIEQMGAKLGRQLTQSHPGLAEELRDRLPRVRYQLWNGQFHAAVNRMYGLRIGTTAIQADLPSAERERANRLGQLLLELRDYLRNNWTGLTNYAFAKRNGLRISSAPAESSMSNLVNQRMGKRQPMCWSSEGAHRLLQVRCAMLDGRLESLFREWHPKFRSLSAAVELPTI